MEDYATEMFNIIISRHRVASTITMVNVPYDINASINDVAHILWAGGKILREAARIYSSVQVKSYGILKVFLRLPKTKEQS